MIKETGIIMSGDHPKLILEGIKTMTRRVIISQPDLLYGIQGDIIQLYYSRRMEDDAIDIKTYTNIANGHLYGWERWEDLLKHEIQGLWEKGFRGVASISRMQDGEEGVFNCLLMPQQQESNNVSASDGMYGFSRYATSKINAGKTFGWRPTEQQTRQSPMGNTIRELARQDTSQSSQPKLQQPELTHNTSREGAYSLGSQGGDSQQETHISGSRNKPAFHFRNMPWSIGLRLWVRETWSDLWISSIDLGDIIYKATPPNANFTVQRWKPSIFMPHWASRITLEITELRAERLQEITEEDAKSEGVSFLENWGLTDDIRGFRGMFKELWDSLNAKRGYGWDTNPWVWVISFKVV